MNNIKYKIEIFILSILDRITYKRCQRCNEIVFDNICDFCIFN